MAHGNGFARAATSDASPPNLALLTAAPVEIDLGGQRFRAAPLTLADYGEIDQAVLAGRPNPLERALAHCEGLSESLQRALLAMAFDELVHGWPVTAHEVALWMCSREGMAHVLWLSIRGAQPDFTIEQCRAVLAAEPDWGRAQRALDQINGLPLGKLLGRASRPKPARSRRARLPGANCFAG